MNLVASYKFDTIQVTQIQFKKSPKATIKMERKIIINPHTIFGTYGRNTSKINRGIVQ